MEKDSSQSNPAQNNEALKKDGGTRDVGKAKATPAQNEEDVDALLQIDEEYTENNSNMASNNWVISGNHTKTGKPLLASDPHLSTGAPSFWTIQHLHFKEIIKGKSEDRFLMGSSSPGMPLILIGRSRDISWGITASVTDVSDIYRERISDDEQSYEVDGQWKELEEEAHVIKVKGQEDVPFTIKHTHRGPLIASSLFQNAQLLHQARLPVYSDFGHFSFVWGGHYPGESMVQLLQGLRQAETLHEVKEAHR